MSDTDAVHVTTVVAVEPTLAFTIFTEEIDAWWQRGYRFRHSADPASTMRFEPGEGGRLVEILDETGATHEWGRVEIWKPGEQLRWVENNPNFGVPIAIEVRFEAHDRGTRMRVIQSGFDAIAADAVARHGLDDDSFLSMMGLWWGDLLTHHRLRCAERQREEDSA